VGKKKKDDDMPDFAAIMAKLQNEEQDKKAKAKKDIAAVSDELFLLGVKFVTVTYNGEGDSGDIEDIIYERVGTETVPTELEARLKTILWAFVPSGFENNEGGYGEMQLDVAGRRVVFTHSERIIETHDTSTEFDF
jgi:hypothetical protein